MTRTFKISAIMKKAKAMPAGYLDDCMTLCQSWDEEKDAAEFTGAALAEIRDTWDNHKPSARRRRCKKCGLGE